MTENLNYNSGDGSYCYDNLSSNCDVYGRLYDWNEAVNGAASNLTTPSGVQGVCPDGWHLPSDAEWTELTDYVIANSAGSSTDNIGPYLKSTSGFNDAGNGTDDFGFSGLPGGNRGGNSYHNVGNFGYWWSSTEYSSTGLYRHLFYGSDRFYRYYFNKSGAFSVRCLQDTP
jgi:uncharacterized protein (TIGR02145 family)